MDAMNGWIYFWIGTIFVSYLIFFGVAIVVGIKGWTDLHHLFVLLRKNPVQGEPEKDQ